MTDLHVLLPDWVDDARRPSGGSRYDLRLCEGLVSRGWQVHRHLLAGPWPWPSETAPRRLRETVAEIPDGATLLVDGIIASATPDVLVPASRRLRLVVLLHLPLGETFPESGDVAATREREAAVLRAADAVVVTSTWTHHRVVARYGLVPADVHIAEPGVDPAPLSTGTRGGTRLVQVGAVTAIKGHDVLLAALATLGDLDWRLRVIGSLDVEPVFASQVQARAAALDGRVELTGTLVGERLPRELAASDLVVIPSRTETYGMVATEGLARGIPVVATTAGGLPSTVGGGAGDVPGLLVAPDDADALASALRRWLEDETLRARLRSAARARRTTLHGWGATVDAFSAVLSRDGASGAPVAVETRAAP